MEASAWFAQHWPDLIQSASVVGSMLFAAYTFRKAEKAQRIANLIAIQQEYCDIWAPLYERPELARILQKDVDLKERPVTVQETLLVKTLILHLYSVRQAMKIGVIVKLQGLQKDVREFLTLPIPGAVWEKMRAFQDADFIAFVESCLHHAFAGNVGVSR